MKSHAYAISILLLVVMLGCGQGNLRISDPGDNQNRADIASSVIKAFRIDMSVCSALYFGEHRLTDSLQVGHPLCREQKVSVGKLKIWSVYVNDGADVHLFDDPNQFPYLWYVVLRTKSANAAHIRSLAANYPSIKYLCVAQTQPLADRAVESLKSFQHLRTLKLECTVATPDLLARSIPTKLKNLELIDYEHPLSYARILAPLN